MREPGRLAHEWINEHRDQINAFVEGLAAFDRACKQIEAEWKDAGLGYLVSPLGAGEQLFLTLYAEPGHAEELFAFMQDALAGARFVAGPELPSITRRSSVMSPASTSSTVCAISANTMC